MKVYKLYQKERGMEMERTGKHERGTDIEEKGMGKTK